MQQGLLLEQAAWSGRPQRLLTPDCGGRLPPRRRWLPGRPASPSCGVPSSFGGSIAGAAQSPVGPMWVPGGWVQSRQEWPHPRGSQRQGWSRQGWRDPVGVGCSSGWGPAAESPAVRGTAADVGTAAVETAAAAAAAAGHGLGNPGGLVGGHDDAAVGVVETSAAVGYVNVDHLAGDLIAYVAAAAAADCSAAADVAAARVMPA